MQGKIVAATPDTLNGFKEAKELRDYEIHLRKKHLAFKYGSNYAGEQAFEAEQRKVTR